MNISRGKLVMLMPIITLQISVILSHIALSTQPSPSTHHLMIIIRIALQFINALSAGLINDLV